MNISYDHYRIFYYVAKYKSFTQAAAVLLNNQPNLTRTVKNLESALGCQLFVRSSRGVSLTPEGEKLYTHVALAFAHIEQAERELSQDKGLQSGFVSIGASEVALHCVLLPALRQFRQRYPGVRIRLSNHSTPQAVAALSEDRVDLAVVTTPLDLPPAVKKVPLLTFREVPVCGPAYAHLTRKALPLAQLTQYPLICLGKQTGTYDFYARWFSRNGLMLTPDIEPATADQILPLVKNDLGIGFIPDAFLRKESEQTGVYRLAITPEPPRREICLLVRTDQPLSAAARALEELLRTQKD